jgi:hypothetical protein
MVIKNISPFRRVLFIGPGITAVALNAGETRNIPELPGVDKYLNQYAQKGYIEFVTPTAEKVESKVVPTSAPDPVPVQENKTAAVEPEQTPEEVDAQVSGAVVEDSEPVSEKPEGKSKPKSKAKGK